MKTDKQELNVNYGNSEYGDISRSSPGEGPGHYSSNSIGSGSNNIEGISVSDKSVDNSGSVQIEEPNTQSNENLDK